MPCEWYTKGQGMCCHVCAYTRSIAAKGRKDMFYLTTHSTYFIYGYMASDSERGNPLPPHELLLSISSKGSFICIISCGALAGTRNSSMRPPHEGSIRRPIAPMKRQIQLPSLPWSCLVPRLVYRIMILNIVSTNISFPLGKMIGTVRS